MENGENSSKKMWVENMYWTQFQTVRFGVFLTGDFTSQLLIPKKFSEKVRKRLPEKVSLRGPAGDSHNWEVQLHISNNTTSLVGESWKDFVTTYGLKENDFLVFKYKYNSYFKVTMLDSDSCWVEKESSYFVMRSDNAPITDHAEKNKLEKVAELRERTSPLAFTDINDGSDQVQERTDSRERALQYCNMSRKVIVEDSDEEGVVIRRKNDDNQWTSAKKSREEHRNTRDYTTESTRTPTSNDTFEWPTDVFKPRKGSSCNHSSRKQGIPRRRSPSASYNHQTQKLGVSERKREPTGWEKERAKQLANQELTDESFLMVMIPSHVGKSFRLALPKGWTAKFMVGCNQDVMLRLYGQGSKEWRIRYYFDKKKGMAQFRTGWNYFARDNALHESDVCVFKLAGRKEGKVCLDVKIIRVIEEEGQGDQPLVMSS